MTKKHNGWSNYETWVVNLWMGNDARTCEYWREQARRHTNYAAECDTRTQSGKWIGTATLDLADKIKTEAEERKPELGPSFYSDLLSAALREVNWLEIAEHWMAEEVN